MMTVSKEIGLVFLMGLTLCIGYSMHLRGQVRKEQMARQKSEGDLEAAIKSSKALP